MASYNASLSTPAAFPFDTPDHLPKWKWRFEQYHLALSSLKESESAKSTPYFIAPAKKLKTF